MKITDNYLKHKYLKYKMKYLNYLFEKDQKGGNGIVKMEQEFIFDQEMSLDETTREELYTKLKILKYVYLYLKKLRESNFFVNILNFGTGTGKTVTTLALFAPHDNNVFWNNWEKCFFVSPMRANVNENFAKLKKSFPNPKYPFFIKKQGISDSDFSTSSEDFKSITLCTVNYLLKRLLLLNPGTPFENEKYYNLKYIFLDEPQANPFKYILIIFLFMVLRITEQVSDKLVTVLLSATIPKSIKECIKLMYQPLYLAKPNTAPLTLGPKDLIEEQDINTDYKKTGDDRKNYFKNIGINIQTGGHYDVIGDVIGIDANNPDRDKQLRSIQYHFKLLKEPSEIKESQKFDLRERHITDEKNATIEIYSIITDLMESEFKPQDLNVSKCILGFIPKVSAINWLAINLKCFVEQKELNDKVNIFMITGETNVDGGIQKVINLVVKDSDELVLYNDPNCLESFDESIFDDELKKTGAESKLNICLGTEVIDAGLNFPNCCVGIDSRRIFKQNLIFDEYQGKYTQVLKLVPISPDIAIQRAGRINRENISKENKEKGPFYLYTLYPIYLPRKELVKGIDKNEPVEIFVSGYKQTAYARLACNSYEESEYIASIPREALDALKPQFESFGFIPSNMNLISDLTDTGEETEEIKLMKQKAKNFIKLSEDMDIRTFVLCGMDKLNEREINSLQHDSEVTQKLLIIKMLSNYHTFIKAIVELKITWDKLLFTDKSSKNEKYIKEKNRVLLAAKENIRRNFTFNEADEAMFDSFFEHIDIGVFLLSYGTKRTKTPLKDIRTDGLTDIKTDIKLIQFLYYIFKFLKRTEAIDSIDNFIELIKLLGHLGLFNLNSFFSIPQSKAEEIEKNPEKVFRSWFFNFSLITYEKAAEGINFTNDKDTCIKCLEIIKKLKAVFRHLLDYTESIQAKISKKKSIKFRDYLNSIKISSINILENIFLDTANERLAFFFGLIESDKNFSVVSENDKAYLLDYGNVTSNFKKFKALFLRGNIRDPTVQAGGALIDDIISKTPPYSLFDEEQLDDNTCKFPAFGLISIDDIHKGLKYAVPENLFKKNTFANKQASGGGGLYKFEGIDDKNKKNQSSFDAANLLYGDEEIGLGDFSGTVFPLTLDAPDIMKLFIEKQFNIDLEELRRILKKYHDFRQIFKQGSPKLKLKRKWNELCGYNPGNSLQYPSKHSFSIISDSTLSDIKWINGQPKAKNVYITGHPAKCYLTLKNNDTFKYNLQSIKKHSQTRKTKVLYIPYNNSILERNYFNKFLFYLQIFECSKVMPESSFILPEINDFIDMLAQINKKDRDYFYYVKDTANTIDYKHLECTVQSMIANAYIAYADTMFGESEEEIHFILIFLGWNTESYIKYKDEISGIIQDLVKIQKELRAIKDIDEVKIKLQSETIESETTESFTHLIYDRTNDKTIDKYNAAKSKKPTSVDSSIINITRNEINEEEKELILGKLQKMRYDVALTILHLTLTDLTKEKISNHSLDINSNGVTHKCIWLEVKSIISKGAINLADVFGRTHNLGSICILFVYEGKEYEEPSPLRLYNEEIDLFYEALKNVYGNETKFFIKNAEIKWSKSGKFSPCFYSLSKLINAEDKEREILLQDQTVKSLLGLSGPAAAASSSGQWGPAAEALGQWGPAAEALGQWGPAAAASSGQAAAASSSGQAAYLWGLDPQPQPQLSYQHSSDGITIKLIKDTSKEFNVNEKEFKDAVSKLKNDLAEKSFFDKEGLQKIEYLFLGLTYKDEDRKPDSFDVSITNGKQTLNFKCKWVCLRNEDKTKILLILLFSMPNRTYTFFPLENPQFNNMVGTKLTSFIEILQAVHNKAVYLDQQFNLRSKHGVASTDFKEIEEKKIILKSDPINYSSNAEKKEASVILLELKDALKDKKLNCFKQPDTPKPKSKPPPPPPKSRPQLYNQKFSTINLNNNECLESIINRSIFDNNFIFNQQKIKCLVGIQSFIDEDPNKTTTLIWIKARINSEPNDKWFLWSCGLQPQIDKDSWNDVWPANESIDFVKDFNSLTDKMNYVPEELRDVPNLELKVAKFKFNKRVVYIYYLDDIN